MPAHNMLIASVGAIILWFGWYGFNPGSTLSAMDYIGIARVATNTTLAACAGGLAAMFYVYPRAKKWDCGMCLNGLLAGLVAITCPCYWVSGFGSIMIGLIAGVVVVWGTDLLEWLRIDDPCGAWPVHGLAGMWGTYSLGLFATGEFGAPTPTGADNSAPVAGLFYHGGANQLVAQFIGNTSICLGSIYRKHGSHVRGKADRHAARLEGRRTRRSRSPRAWRRGLPGGDHIAPRPHDGGGQDRAGVFTGGSNGALSGRLNNRSAVKAANGH